TLAKVKNIKTHLTTCMELPEAANTRAQAIVTLQNKKIYTPDRKKHLLNANVHALHVAQFMVMAKECKNIESDMESKVYAAPHVTQHMLAVLKLLESKGLLEFK